LKKGFSLTLVPERKFLGIEDRYLDLTKKGEASTNKTRISLKKTQKRKAGGSVLEATGGLLVLFPLRTGNLEGEQRLTHIVWRGGTECRV